MRTTITINEELLRQAKRLSGCEGLSKAVVTSLQEYVALRQRLSLLERLFSNKTSHSFPSIKKRRKKGQWSS